MDAVDQSLGRAQQGFSIVCTRKMDWRSNLEIFFFRHLWPELRWLKGLVLVASPWSLACFQRGGPIGANSLHSILGL